MKTPFKFKVLCLFCACTAVMCIAADARLQLPRTKDQIVKPDPDAVAVANAWLAILDSGNYTKSFELMPPRIRASGAVGEQEYLSFLRSRRRPLGNVRSRSLLRARFSRTIASGPDGNYEFLDYETAFTRKAEAWEIVTLTNESGHWQVSGYRVR
jgi:hypothetical protein